MAYQVIARKYRPQRFADVVGQEHVTQTLINAIQQNRIAHAYLFVGPRGTGKTTLARIFAKCLNCTGGPKSDFPDDDPRCMEIAEGRSLDVLEIDGASNRGIEEIRELRETVKYAPATSRFKIYIIDEVHMLTKEAFNALLKTLEEPPEHVKFMFATTEPEKVLPTILSRCQRFDLRRIPASLIAKHLGHIARLEGVDVEEPALYAIARGAEGGMRDAESTLDQLISFCGNRIVEADVLAMFGLAARGQLLALAAALISGNAEAALREFNGLAQGGKDLGRLLSDLLHHFRNLLLYQVSRGDVSLLEVSEMELASLKEQSANLTTESLTRLMDVLTECETRLRDAASKRIWIEVALLKAVQARNAIDINLVLQKLQSLRAGHPPLDPGVPAAPAGGNAGGNAKEEPPGRTAQSRLAGVVSAGNEASQGATVAPAKETVQMGRSVEAGHSRSADLASIWARVLDEVGRASPFARSYLLDAHPVALTKNLFTIGFDPEFADRLGLVDNAKNRALIQAKLNELGFGDVQVKFVQAAAPSDWVRPTVSQEPSGAVESGPVVATPVAAAVPEVKAKSVEPILLNKEEFKNDPLIKQALEIFKGTIVDVRT